MVIRKEEVKKNFFVLTYKIIICFLSKLNRTLKA